MSDETHHSDDETTLPPQAAYTSKSHIDAADIVDGKNGEEKGEAQALLAAGKKDSNAAKILEALQRNLKFLEIMLEIETAKAVSNNGHYIPPESSYQKYQSYLWYRIRHNISQDPFSAISFAEYLFVLLPLLVIAYMNPFGAQQDLVEFGFIAALLAFETINLILNTKKALTKKTSDIATTTSVIIRLLITTGLAALITFHFAGNYLISLASATQIDLLISAAFGILTLNSTIFLGYLLLYRAAYKDQPQQRPYSIYFSKTTAWKMLAFVLLGLSFADLLGADSLKNFIPSPAALAMGLVGILIIVLSNAKVIGLKGQPPLSVEWNYNSNWTKPHPMLQKSQTDQLPFSWGLFRPPSFASVMQHSTNVEHTTIRTIATHSLKQQQAFVLKILQSEINHLTSESKALPTSRLAFISGAQQAALNNKLTVLQHLKAVIENPLSKNLGNNTPTIDWSRPFELETYIKNSLQITDNAPNADEQIKTVLRSRFQTPRGGTQDALATAAIYIASVQAVVAKETAKPTAESSGSSPLSETDRAKQVLEQLFTPPFSPQENGPATLENDYSAPFNFESWMTC